jgi:hypothetical protein
MRTDQTIAAKSVSLPIRSELTHPAAGPPRPEWAA